MKEVEAKLQELLESAVESRNGLKSSCAVFTQQGTYFGINKDKEVDDFYHCGHSLSNTLKDILEKESAPVISKIIILANRATERYKHYILCDLCDKEIDLYVAENCVVTLLWQDKDQVLDLKYSEISACYKKLPYSKITSTKKEEVSSELKVKTLLDETDLAFITDLTLYGQKEKIEIYITGSSCGRGSISNLLMRETNTSYRDIDLLVVSSDHKNVRKDIEKILKEDYKEIDAEEKTIPDHKKDIIFSKVFYNIKDRPIVDITFSNDRDGSFIRPPYRDNYWYHQLS